MTETTDIQPSYLTSQQANHVMAMLRDVDSVEIKMTVPMEQQQATVLGLRLDPVEAEPRHIFFFDTPDLALHKAGIAVRARRSRGGSGDTVVKLRPVVPADLPDDVRRSGSFKMEIDVAPGGFVCSGSMKGKATGDEVREVATGQRRLSKILTKERSRVSWSARNSARTSRSTGSASAVTSRRRRGQPSSSTPHGCGSRTMVRLVARSNSVVSRFSARTHARATI